jgi:tetratricopeptide (TPR) repeat protein
MTGSDEPTGPLPEGLGPLDDRPGPARPLAPEAATALVAVAIDRASRGRPALSGRRRVLLVAAAAVLAAAAAAASAGLLFFRGSGDESPEAVAAPHAVPTSVVAAPSRGASAQAAATSRSSAVAEPPVVPENPAAAPVRPAAEPPALPNIPRPPVEPRAARAADAPAGEAQDLLAEANRLRRERRWADAERAYVSAMSASPGSDAAYAATMGAAGLRLDRLGRAAEALPLFEAALRNRPRGALAEDAAWGVAECVRALGNRDREIEALRLFLERWPQSLMAERARARLQELGAGAVP